jgi:hypothetical protein
LFGADGVYGPDIRARVEHRSSLDVYEARGGKLPRARPAPRVTEIHAGSVVEGDRWKITVGHAQHVQPYLQCLRRAGVKTLVLTHLLAQIDRPAIREQIVHEVRQMFDGAVIRGEDLMRLTVRRTGVESIETRTVVTNPSRD